MKLFLSSVGLPNPAAYKALFGAKTDPRVAIIPNAWDTTPIDKSQPYIDATARALMASGVRVELVDLRQYSGKQGEFKTVLSEFDGVWVMGGNSFYLNWITLQAGLGGILVELSKGGFVYGGESAGAVIAGTTLHGIELLDDPKEAPAAVWQGLGLINCGILPHWDDKNHAEQLKECLGNMQQHTQVITLADDQYLTLSGKDLQVLRG